MRKTTTALLFASILSVGAMTAPTLHAEGNDGSSGSMMGHGMMGHGMMGDKDSKGGGEIMGMMKMMKQMSEMMDHCSKMMSAENKSRDEMPKTTPEAPEKK